MSTSWKAVAAACVALGAAGCEEDPAALDPTKPVAVVVESGNNQTGQIGAELALDPRVRVIGQTGLPVQGVPVQFQAGPGSGAVVTSSAVTDGQGVASAGPWTLGDALGEQQVMATVAELPPAVFTATATDIPALLEAVAGAGQEAEVGTDVEVPPTVRVLNAAGAPVANLPVTFLATSGFVTGAEARTGADGRAAVGRWTLGAKSGVQELIAAVAGGAIKGNPAVFQAVARSGPPMVLEASRGDGQEIEVESPAAVRPEVRVLDAYGNGVPGVDILFEATGGDGAILGGEQTTGQDGLASVAAWFAGPEEGAAQTATATTVSGPPGFVGRSVTFNATSVAQFFDIVLVHAPESHLDDNLVRLFAEAEATWEAVIGGNLSPVPMPGQVLSDCAEDVDHPPLQVVDDLIIYANVGEIDGSGGVLGFAGPCFVRRSDGLPLAGVMVFDVEDVGPLVALEGFEGTIVHEMGHVLGIGTLWSDKELLQDPAPQASEEFDTHFTGPQAIARFDEVGGEDYLGAKVPVENLGGGGTRNGHWRESVFGSELLTGYYNPGVANPFSVVTIASMEDLGYAEIDYGVAEPYRLPTPESAAALREGPRIRFVDDIRAGPVGIVDEEGRVVGRILPRQANNPQEN